MTLKQLIKKSGLKKEDLNRTILFSCDEELNTLYEKAEIALDEKTGNLLLYPLSGTERME